MIFAPVYRPSFSRRRGINQSSRSRSGALVRPYPNNRRNASLRDLIPLRFAHLSTADMTFFGRRTAATGSRPVAGRPRPRFFWFTAIDFAMY
jgi:hypothetical protein